VKRLSDFESIRPDVPAADLRERREVVVNFMRELNAFGTGDSRVIIGLATVAKDRTTWKIKGPAAEGDFRQGLTYRLYGRWVEHERYGWQFAFQSFVLSAPLGRRGIVAYLKQAPGIGEAGAAALFAEFGEQAVEVVRTNPALAAAKVRTLSEARAKVAAKWLEERDSLESVTIELTGLFAGRGFPRVLVKKCIDTWGNAAPGIIRENPYKLIRFSGVGFLTADRLYLDLGCDPNALERQAWCIWHAANASTGDTWRSESEVLSTLRGNISSTEIRTADACRQAVEMGLIATRQDAEGRRWIASKDRAEHERVLAECVADLLSEPATWPDMLEDDQLSVHQRGKVVAALTSPIACLTGTPGTGKTYSAGRIVRALLRDCGYSVAAVAPTGKAAVRCTETMAQMGINLEATTIHRLLGVEKPGGEGDSHGWQFAFGKGNPLPFKYLVVDESSMLDSFVAASLLSACAPGTHILFIGDTNQLPPVGHGSPLRDMIKAGVPCGELTEIRRNSGQIVAACAAMRQKATFETSSQWSPETGDNLYLINGGTPATQLAQLEAVVGKIVASGKYDPRWHVQVLCAVNTKSEVSRRALNSMLQNLLNRDGLRDASGQNPFRVGDKIINLKNTWTPSRDPNDELCNKDGKVYVANGEQAEVLEVAPRYTVAELQNPYRVVRIPRGKADDEGDSNGSNDDDKTATGCQWDLAYAVSVHKSQGSQWPIVIVVLDASGSASRVCDRSWLYTAISRAQVGCLLIGKQQTAREFTSRSSLHNRKTFLAEDVQRNMAKLGVTT
jgi:exodeoxyribonuclease V alpha subunit